MQGLQRRTALPEPSSLRQEIIFGGEKGAKTAPKGAGPGLPVEEAKKLEKSGAKSPEIFQQTGWYRGADGEWKWTLSDKGASLNQGAFTAYQTGGVKPVDEMALKAGWPRTLPEVLNHPDLYKTYPQLKDVKVDRLPLSESKTGAIADFDSKTNTMRITGFRSATDIISSILHELQHAVQKEEGFGRGSNFEENLPSEVRRGERQPTREEKDLAYENYKLSSGETEARQAQKQFETKNWSQLPTQMEGFPAPDKQLVRRGNELSLGKSYQLADGTEVAEVDHDPFAEPQLEPVEHNPYLTPVDHDPFATMEGVNAAYTKPGAHVYNTPLEPQAEEAFRGWVQQNNVPFDPEAGMTDYDMRGFWLGLQNGDLRAASAIDPHDEKLHYPDYWKTPLHQTFSNESQWATPDAPKWTQDGQLVDNQGNVVFAPPPPREQSSPYQAGYDMLPGQDPGAAEQVAKADLSQDDAVIIRNPSGFDPKDMQSGWWAGGAPTSFAYPRSPTTDPFVTPEYGLRSGPGNRIIDDRPPEIPPGYSATRGEHSRYRPPRRSK